MVYRAIHRDVKIAALQLAERQLLPLNDILLCCGFSRSTYYRIMKLWRETGDVINEPVLHGRYRTLHHTDIHYLLQLIRQNPDYFLDELLRMLRNNRFISVHYTTIHEELTRAGVSRKRLQRIARERNEALRADFIARMAQFYPEELGFIDEVSKDERTVGRRYGRSRRGTRARKSQPFVRGRRTSTVGVLSVDGFVAGTSVEGSLTKASFLHWMEFTVVCYRVSLHLPLAKIKVQ
jgi:transposase